MSVALAFPDKDEQRAMEVALLNSGAVRQVLPAQPFDLDSAITELVAERLPDMRERERQEMCAKVKRGGFPEWLRHRDLGLLCGLMFVAVLGVAWVAELKMEGAW